MLSTTESCQLNSREAKYEIKVEKKEVKLFISEDLQTATPKNSVTKSFTLGGTDIQQLKEGFAVFKPVGQLLLLTLHVAQ